MSNHICSLVYKRALGSLPRKALLALMADKADNDGTGVSVSKSSLAIELDISRQLVIRTIKSLVADGLLIECGKLECKQGFIVQYSINVEALRALPEPCKGGIARGKKATISAFLCRNVMERDKYRCVTCGTHLDLTCDHVLAESRGGETTLDNLQTMCRHCNSKKGARP